MTDIAAAYRLDVESQEREDMYSVLKGATYDKHNFVVFAYPHANTAGPVDATELEISEVLELIDTHTGPNAVHITHGQVIKIYNILHVNEEELV